MHSQLTSLDPSQSCYFAADGGSSWLTDRADATPQLSIAARMLAPNYNTSAVDGTADAAASTAATEADSVSLEVALNGMRAVALPKPTAALLSAALALGGAWTETSAAAAAAVNDINSSSDQRSAGGADSGNGSLSPSGENCWKAPCR